MRVAPALNPAVPNQLPRPLHLLLINPFYPKDPHASFGKHVLTPTLALSSIAAAVPSDWTVQIWERKPAAGTATVATVSAGCRYQRSSDIRSPRV